MSVSRTMITNGIVAALAIGMPVMAADKTASVTTLPANDTGASTTSRLFISGHSLTDRPFPDYLQEIAAAGGISLQWNMHHLPGSSILQRLHDKKAFFAETPQREKHQPEPGQDRDAIPAPDGHGYDVMVITEQHRVLDSLIWQNAVQSLRDYHDRFIAANTTGKTYFFAPWISVSDRANPSDWIVYEKEALPIWQCVVSQVNQDLAADGRTDRIQFIPTSWALARLVEHVTANADVAGFEGLDTAAKMDAIFSDTVHLSRLGAYYVAAISYSTIYSDNLPALSPPSLDAGQAEAVRKFATAFMQEYRSAPVPSDEVCSSGVSLAFASHYAAYTERTYHQLEEGVFAARIKRLRDTMRFAWRFRNGLK